MCELAPREFVGTSMGFLDTIMDVGQTLGPILSGFILSSVFQYVGLFWTLSAVLFATAAIFTFSKAGRTKQEKYEPNSTRTPSLPSGTSA
jgi:MFS family permease